jgi:hypothetical protein
MASAGPQGVVQGTDGSDFGFRQSVLNVYQHAALAKQKLASLTKFFVLLALVIFTVGVMRLQSTVQFPFRTFLGGAEEDFPGADMLVALVFAGLAFQGQSASSASSDKGQSKLVWFATVCRICCGAVGFATLRSYDVWSKIGIMAASTTTIAPHSSPILLSVLHFLAFCLCVSATQFAVQAASTYTQCVSTCVCVHNVCDMPPAKHVSTLALTTIWLFST